MSKGLFLLDPDAWPGLPGPIAQTAVLLANLAITARSRRTKILIVRTLQRFVVNPLVRLLFRLELNPLGLAILETRGRVSGSPAGHRSATAAPAPTSGSSPSTGRGPGTCATSGATRACGSGCASA
jgi:hypothetical protein